MKYEVKKRAEDEKVDTFSFEPAIIPTVISTVDLSVKDIITRINAIDCDFSAKYWETPDGRKHRVYVSVGRTDKKITIDLDEKRIFANRPGAFTQAWQIKENVLTDYCMQD